MNKLILAILLLVAGCNVETTDHATGGVTTAQGDCGGGVVAVLSDYLSTQVALLDRGGDLLSESFISSGSTEASGLAAPLSGDVTGASNPARSNAVVLIDRYGTNVITWVDAQTARVRAQLPVGSGFESNPHDYLEVSATKAYVPRWGENVDHGKQPLDRGGDVLIVNPAVPEIVGSIDLHEASGSELPPRPAAVTLRGNTAIVVLQRLALNFREQGDSELAGIDTGTDSLAWAITIEGLKGCGRAALSPSEERLALACSGEIDASGKLVDPNASGIVLFDATTAPPTELERLSTHEALGFAPQPGLAFASEDTLLAKTQTPYLGRGNNVLFAVSLQTGAFRVLAEAAANEDGSGKGIVFGSLYCSTECTRRCLLTDAAGFRVRRFDLDADLTELEPVVLGDDIGLPPVYLGTF